MGILNLSFQRRHIMSNLIFQPKSSYIKQCKVKIFYTIIAHVCIVLFLCSSAYCQNNRIAVLPFKDITDYSIFSKRYTNFVHGLPEMLMSELGNSNKYKIIERAQIDNALKNFEIEQSGLIDEEKAIKIGQWLGATSIILGNFIKKDDKIRIDSRIIDVKTGTLLSCAKIIGEEDNLINLADSLAIEINKNFALNSVVLKKIFKEDLYDWNKNEYILHTERDSANSIQDFIISGRINPENGYSANGLHHFKGSFEVYIDENRIAIVTPEDTVGKTYCKLCEKSKEYFYRCMLKVLNKENQYSYGSGCDVVSYIEFQIEVEQLFY
ncbi:MAG: hypothetical protein GF353_14860 [Candidatus Lokiarchaeota archaeon]|nr:hypothetical protein [Candidatus Lokiarchaeota archaeon]